jgi:eukaryotic-like serine/threonine-protein kinase
MGTVEAALELDRGADDAATKNDYQRVVALKRLLPDARDARRVEMFLREARLAVILDHPNVVRAYDYGELEGELVLAMEYVEGQALSRVLRALADAGEELGVALTAHVLAEVCEGLHAAHELRDASGRSLALVHRDVSPQNVMLAHDGQVRLLDFGVAKIDTESVTKTGEVKGKTAYMSPEQAMGDPVDRRSDLFGVGAVLFECLALRRMWGDGTDMDVIRKLALEAPPRLEEVVPEATPEIGALYTRLVAREASGRPATAKDVADELRALVPQGRESASRALRELLEKHFGQQAEEQRRRLTTSLEEVAPDQARELRESTIPASRPLPTEAHRPKAPTESSASLAQATEGATGHERSEAAAAATKRQTTWPWLGLGAVVVGLVVWRVGAGPAPASEVAAGAVPSAGAAPSASASSAAAAPSGSALPSGATASTPPEAAPTATATTATATATTATATATTRATATATTRATATTTLTAPSSSVRAPAVARSGAVTSPSPPPSATTKPPPDVDDHPF